MEYTTANPVRTRAAGLRTLPVRVGPLAGEALDSWLEALATRARSSWGDILIATGLRICADATTRRPVLTLDARQIAALHYTTGVATTTLWSMSAASLLSAPQDVAATRTLLMAGSRFCPRCLADNGGRWLLWWRLRWAFACPTHHCLLADYCPACRRRQRVESPPLHLVPVSHRCARPAPGARGTRTPPRCGARLSDAVTAHVPAGGTVLRAQRQILDIIEAKTAARGIYRGAAVSATAYAADLTFLGKQLLLHHQQDALWPTAWDGGAAPPWALNRDDTRADAAAYGACLAVPVLASDSLPEAIRAIRSDVAPASLQTVAHCLRLSRTISDPLSRVGHQLSRPRGPVEQLRAADGHATALASSDRYRSVPALIWPEVAYPFAVSGLSFERLRHALSVAVLLAGSSMNLDQACAKLGHIYPTRSVARALHQLHTHPRWPDCVDAVAGIARTIAMVPSPIDYDRRRSLSYDSLLPDEVWQQICYGQAILMGRGVKSRLYRCWLFERLTGSPASSSSHASSTSKFAATLAALPRTLTRVLADALDHAGRMFLDDRGLESEPLCWQPDFARAGTVTAPPGADTIAWLHDMVVDGNMSMSAAADLLHTTVGAVRALLNDRPPQRTTHGGLTGGGAVYGARRAMPPEELRRLYEHEGMSLAQIAQHAHLSRSTVAGLAHEYGLAMRAAHRPPAPARRSPSAPPQSLKAPRCEDSRLPQASGGTESPMRRTTDHPA